MPRRTPPSISTSIRWPWAAEGVDDLGQDVEGGRRGVELASAVVRHHDAGGARLGRAQGVVRPHDPLDQHRQLGDRPQPGHVPPRQRRIEEGGDVGGEPGIGGGRRHLAIPLRQQVGHGEAGRQAEAVPHVPLPPSEQRRVDGEHQRAAAGGLGPPHQPLGGPAVAVDVELEPDRPGGGGHHLLDPRRGERREDHHRPRRSGRPGGRQLPLGSREAVERGGRDEHRHRDRLAEHGGRQIAAGDVHQHPVGDDDAVVGGAVLAQGDLVVSAPRVVVIGLPRELLAGDRLELEEVERFHRAIV